MRKPAMMLMAMMRMVAIESRWLKRAAPSIAPQNSASRATMFAALAGLVGIDKAGVEVGVDRHLLAGHGVEGETRRDFSGADGAVADDEILDGHQGEEDDEADDVIAADDELAEGLDDLAGCCRAFIAVQQNAARAGDVERQAHQGHAGGSSWGRPRTRTGRMT